MTIIAKRVSPNGTVTDVVMSDDPADIEIIDQFPGARDYRVVCCAGDFHAVHGVKENCSNGDCDILIVGKPPSMGNLNPKRKSAKNLTVSQARNFAKAAREKLGKNC